jgi:hypothetical protein
LMRTRGWPRGSMLGPWREWQETMSTSSGRCFSKAAISGALHDVWPPTIAPCLVAGQKLVMSQNWLWSRGHTWPIHCNYLVNRGCFHIVDDIITCSGYEVTIGEYFYLLLWNISALVEGDAIYKVVYIICEIFTQSIIFLFSIAGIDPDYDQLACSTMSSRTWEDY